MTIDCKRNLFITGAINKILPATTLVVGIDDMWHRLWVAYNLQEKVPGLYESAAYPGVLFLKEDDFIMVGISVKEFQNEDTVIFLDCDILQFGAIFTDKNTAYLTDDAELTIDYGECEGDKVCRTRFSKPRSGFIVARSDELERLFNPFMISPEFIRKVVENDLEDAFDMFK